MSSNKTTLPVTFNHGDPSLVCFPTKWTDIAIFFIGNYIAHAATVLSRPGQSAYASFENIVLALSFPVTGIIMGFEAMLSRANFEATDLRKAARAGALCGVVEVDQYKRTYREHSLIHGPKFLRSNIHGRVLLPAGYGLAILPAHSRFEEDKGSEAAPIVICSNWSVLKIIVSMAQVVFAVTTLYRARGTQIDEFGYAAFGLTVIQYALMSIVNLVGNLMCPQYPAMYLVQTKTMVAAQQKGAVVDGIVGVLDEDVDYGAWLTAQQAPSDWRDSNRRWWMLLLCWTPITITICVIAALTRFRKNNSTVTERVLTMTWLAIGSYFGCAGFLEHRIRKLPMRKVYCDFVYGWILYLAFAAPVMGGFWVVADQLMRYGVCSRIG